MEKLNLVPPTDLTGPSRLNGCNFQLKTHNFHGRTAAH